MGFIRDCIVGAGNRDLPGTPQKKNNTAAIAPDTRCRKFGVDMKPRQKRFIFILLGIAIFSSAVGLILYALQNNVSLYFTPTQVYNKEAPQGKNFRIGGLVAEGSLKREQDGLTLHFDVTDTYKTMRVNYKGILPDLFKEGKGVVAHGKMETDNTFIADEILAKHDENYNAAEVVTALEQANKAKQVVPALQPAASGYKIPSTK
jgi:cytochrome c-type biogenesis protein CcmE